MTREVIKGSYIGKMARLRASRKIEKIPGCLIKVSAAVAPAG